MTYCYHAIVVFDGLDQMIHSQVVWTDEDGLASEMADTAAWALNVSIGGRVVHHIIAYRLGSASQVERRDLQ